jgi:ATP-dependent Lon protease
MDSPKKFERAIIKIQRKYKSLKSNLSTLNYSISFQKDYLTGMINNLSAINNLKLYQDTEMPSNGLFISILTELKQIKDMIDTYPENLNLKEYTDNNSFTTINKEINDLLIKYSNHISSECVGSIFSLFIGEDWMESFSKEDLEIFLFLNRFLKPISVWDSSFHKDEIQYIPVTVENDMKKMTNVTKDIIENLMGMLPKVGNNMKSNSDMKINSIIINPNDITAPVFLKSINDLIELSPKNTNKRTNHFSNIDCTNILDNNNIKITKNTKAATLLEDKFGVYVYIKVNGKYLIIQGLLKDDLLNISSSISFVKNKLKAHNDMLTFELLSVPKHFKDNFLKIISLRDNIVYSSNELCEEVKRKYNDFRTIQSKSLLNLINEFLLASKYRKIDILTLLLMSNEDDMKVAYILFDVFKMKDKKDVSTDVYQALHYSIREKLDITKVKTEKEENELMKITESEIPYERKISMMKTNDDIKAKAMEKLKSMKTNFQGDSKAQSWLDGLLKIPFNTFSENEIISYKNMLISKIKENHNISLFSDNEIDIFINSLVETDPTNSLITDWTVYKIDKKNYLKDVRKTLDTAVYGHKDGKTQLERIFAQWINGETKGAVLGLQGPPGTGKTSLAKNGLSKCLKDKNGKPRPFVFLPIGGSVNGSTLVGHNFTYVGSTWGRIADILMTTGCMNPIIFIDEVDKVSHTEHGREIISILTHLTDSTQNDEFEDKFFSGIKLDLSKALIVFSFNDPSLIDPILRDRITIIETHPLSLPEKVTIIRDYMFPEICKEVGFSANELILSDDMIRFLIETYTLEAGVRKIKEKIVEIVRDINLNRFHNDNIVIPFTITEEYVKDLFENNPKIRIKKIHTEPAVGLVNGLYATTSGVGGITVIQLTRYPTEKMLDIQLTGKAGDVMKESVQYSMKVAWSILTKEQQDELIEAANNKKSYGIHVHCPDGATPKDGPSAGAAFTLAIYSILTGRKVNNKVCMTGEIDLMGNVTAIGGVESKLNGGKKAGCTLALIPEENMEDLERLRREGLSPEDDNFKVMSINHIKQVIEYALL